MQHPDFELFDRFCKLSLELRNTAAVVQNDHEQLIQDGLISADDVRRNASQFIERCEGHLMELQALAHATELLQRQHLQPVPVSERLPGPEECDAEGRCWMGYWDSHTNGLGNCHKTWFWTLEDLSMVDEYTHWLPAHALPLPLRHK